MFGKAYAYLVVGKRSAQLSGGKWTREKMDQFSDYQNQWTTYLADIDHRRYWMYRGRVYSDNEFLNQEQVHALLVTRDQRQQRQVDRAVGMVARGESPQSGVRAGIPDDVKQYVWQRDRGCCRNCGVAHELQFDHIIPVAWGGSSEPENLQLLCGPCNRAKGAGLTNRGPAR